MKFSLKTLADRSTKQNIANASLRTFRFVFCSYFPCCCFVGLFLYVLLLETLNYLRCIFSIVASRLFYFVQITIMFLMTTFFTVSADWIIRTIPSDVPCIITVKTPFLKSGFCLHEYDGCCFFLPQWTHSVLLLSANTRTSKRPNLVLLGKVGMQFNIWRYLEPFSTCVSFI